MALVSNGRENAAPDRSGQGPVRHGHTVGLDIPCQVARLQSLTPLLQATVILPERPRRPNERARAGRWRGPDSRGVLSRSRAGFRLHPEVRHGAMRRRWC